MNEIKVLVRQENGVVDFNYEDIKNALTDQMSIYKTLVFTEDQKPIAKNDVATLRKLKTAIDTRRKEVKKTFMQPYTDFESKVKELTSLIDEPIELINKQVAEFEAKQKAEKQEKIKQIYKEIIEDKAELLPLDKIYKKEWENASTTLKSIRQDITDKMFHLEQDLKMLENFESDAYEKARQMYLNDYDVSSAISYIQQYEKQKKEIEERERIRKEEETKRKAEQERIEEEKRIAEERRKKEEQALAEQTASEAPATETTESDQDGFIIPEDDVQGFGFPQEESQGFNVNSAEQTATFTVTGTAEEIGVLRDYIRAVFAKYEEI